MEKEKSDVYLNAIGHAVMYALISLGPGAMLYIPIFLLISFLLQTDIFAWISDSYNVESSLDFLPSAIIVLSCSNVLKVSQYIKQLERFENNTDELKASSFANEIKASAKPSLIFALIAYLVWITLCTIYRHLFDVWNLNFMASTFSVISLWLINCLICCIYYNKKAYDNYNRTDMKGLF
jgi:hypothetical protein